MEMGFYHVTAGSLPEHSLEKKNRPFPLFPSIFFLPSRYLSKNPLYWILFHVIFQKFSCISISKREIDLRAILILESLLI